MTDSTSSLRCAIKDVLSRSSQSLDCEQLFLFPEVKKHAVTTSRLSRCLGMLWRAGVLERQPSVQPQVFREKMSWRYRWKAEAATVVGRDTTTPQHLPVASLPSDHHSLSNGKNSSWQGYVDSLRKIN